MYHIIELENGQPMIFEQSARQIKSYLIANGRVFSKGYVFKDFKKDFNVYSVNPPLVSYYSVDNSFVLTQVTQNSFQEVLCLKTSCATLVFNNKLYVFYLDNSLMGVCSDNLTEKHCIVENLSGSNHLLLYIIIAFLLQLTMHFMKSTWILMWFVSRKLIFLWIIWLTATLLTIIKLITPHLLQIHTKNLYTTTIS